MLYIHIPFCKSRCVYCNFFSTTKLELMERYADALTAQLRDVGTGLAQARFETIYLGGGTPSVLPQESLGKLLAECAAHLTDGGEFTVECNPDDITPQLANLLYNNGVNRGSLGAQTFDNKRLRLINRRHSAEKTHEAIRVLRENGIRNISIDLMYGFPSETIEDWKRDIDEAIKLRGEHISAYCLSVEEDTALHKMIERGDIPSPPDDVTLENMFHTLRQTLTEAGYEHYEISNFCKPGFHSRHNSGYWQDKGYVGLGAGAHGYEVRSAECEVRSSRTRYWNIRDVEQYISNVREGKTVIEGSEEITPELHYNDLITTAMRTSKGLSPQYILESCGKPYHEYFQKTANRLARLGLVEISKQSGNVRISPDKMFVSNDILADFIY